MEKHSNESNNTDTITIQPRTTDIYHAEKRGRENDSVESQINREQSSRRKGKQKEQEEILEHPSRSTGYTLPPIQHLIQENDEIMGERNPKETQLKRIRRPKRKVEVNVDDPGI